MKKNHTQVQPSTNKKKGNIKKNDEVNIISLIDYPNFSKKIYIVDVANVCGAQVAKKKKISMEVFGKIVEALKSLKIEPKNIIGFVDASFKYKLKDLLMYQKYIEQGLILMTPAGVKADKYILSFCIKHPNSLMITNDLMREYDSSLPSYKWIKEKRVTVLIVRDELFLIPMLDYYQEKESDISSSENQNQFPILDRIFAQKGELNLYGEV